MAARCWPPAVRAEVEFHGAALDLLGAAPEFSLDRERELVERQERCETTFPASVVEWFALTHGERLFEEHSNQDRLVPVDELGDPDETDQGYLCVALENQGVVAFYVRLDEGDDPPVYDNNDEFGAEDLSQVGWNLLSASFSNFVFDMCTIARLQGRRRGLHLSASGPIPDDHRLALVRARLTPGPVTRTPDTELHRFYGPHEYATVRWTPGSDEPAQWQLEADSEPALDELRALVDSAAGVPRRGLLTRLGRRKKS
jgi:hypothetical protein